MKSKGVAALLAFFLGGLGVHRFYLGQTGLGIAYLVFCWTFIPAIIALIDCIVFVASSEESFNRKYNLAYVTNPSAATVASSPQAMSLVPATAPPPVQNQVSKQISDSFYVAGMAYYDYQNIKQVIRDGLKISLVAEPENAHDKNAVKVLVGNNQIGHVPAQKALTISTYLGIYDAYEAKVDGYDPEEEHVDDRVRVSARFFDRA